MRLKPYELSDKFVASTIGSASAVVILLIARKLGIDLKQDEAAAIAVLFVAAAGPLCAYVRPERAFDKKIAEALKTKQEES